MNALDVLCAQLTRDLFAIAKFLLTITRLLLHCWYSLGRHVTTGTPVVIFVLFWLCFYCFWRLVHRWYTVCTVLVDLWRFVHQCFWVFLTIGTMNHSSKTVKRQSNSKNDHWCTNRHMSTKTVPTVYQSSKTVKTAQKWPLVYQSSHVYQDCTNRVPVVQCGLCTTQPIISQNDPFISVQFVWLPLLVLGLSCRSLLLVASGSQFSVVSGVGVRM